MKQFKSIIFLFLLTRLFFSCNSEVKETRPNIVVILCDDLGYGDLSSYGHPIIQTPNLDRLAEDGIKFTSFYAAAPVCSPARAGLLTGRSPNRAGIYDYIRPSERSTNECLDLVHLQADEQTIPAMLKEAGYSTCLAGKWHLNSKFNSEAQPTPGYFGFDHWFAVENVALPSHENPNNFVRNGKEVGEMKGFSCQIIVDEVLNWLQNKETGNPFYALVSFPEPHGPIESPQYLVEDYLPKSINENQAQYFANVANIDDAVVSLLDFMPTFAEISGAKLPERALDGQSMIPVIKTGKMERHKPLLWIFYDAINEHRVAMRTDNWKILARMKNDTSYLPLIHNLYEGNEELVKQAYLVDFELYNMKEDIKEAENVAKKYPEQF
ncbi:MAG: sulfatase-like hydrolase/transferase [Mariniphaga sp.]|nr:sulfatase-like hydrolase/transferase [Mariniphaga sp.]